LWQVVAVLWAVQMQEAAELGAVEPHVQMVPAVAKAVVRGVILMEVREHREHVLQVVAQVLRRVDSPAAAVVVD
jgi:flagellar biosynthesis/type III secretory pathway protein FliH